MYLYFPDKPRTKNKIYRTIILPVVLYGCETWSLTLREEHRLRVFDTFGPKWDKVTGEWRRLHIEELCDLYSSPNIIRVIKSRRITWDVHVARMRDSGGAYRTVVVKSDGKRPVGRPRHRRENNIQMCRLQEVVWSVMDWIALAEDSDSWGRGASDCGNESPGSIK